MPKTSRWWPYIRAIARALRVPGTDLGPSILVDVQDKLDAAEHNALVKNALEEIRRNTAAVVDALCQEGVEQPDHAIKKVAEVLYLDDVARQFLYADFRGIEQYERALHLELDEIFVNLKAVREETLAEQHAREHDLVDKLAGAEEADRGGLERELAELGAHRLEKLRREGTPRPIDQILREHGAAVLLGGPGSGKTTLVKRLARSCALGKDTLRSRFPALDWRFPVVIPVGLFAAEAMGHDLLDYAEHTMDRIGGAPLKEAFRDHWRAGQCLLLLDGLDEVVDAAVRVACARAVEPVIQQAQRNAVLLTSRIIGYNICRPNVPVATFVLQPFDREDIKTFVANWERAYELSVHEKAPDLQKAEAQARALADQILSNPRVEALATNPLMLTIIGFIKQQHVTLPERRVQLYDAALNTLIRSWNKARSLAPVPVGQDLDAEDSKMVWGAIAFWMHQHKAHGTCHREELVRELRREIEAMGYDRLAASQTAESYLHAASEKCGLLEERGTNVFAFLHQTFQEYLAARHLCSDPDHTVERLLAHAHDPRWHEVVRLAAGYLGVVQGSQAMATRVVEALADDEARLEPYLCTSLLLAAGCVADDVRASRHAAQKVLRLLFERAMALPYEEAGSALLKAMSGLLVIPDESTIELLLKAARHDDWRIRMEATRCLGRVASGDGRARDKLEELLKADSNYCVKAHAALGLWRAGGRREELALSIFSGISSGPARMVVSPEPDLVSIAVRLLEHEHAGVRYLAAEALWNWCPQAEALPALLKLLQDGMLYVRLSAAATLGSWGHQPEALRALLKLLEDEAAPVRYSGSAALGSWGRQAEALPGLIRLLEDKDSSVRSCAAATLGSWGHRAAALPALLKLLEDKDSDVRHCAAETLGSWGPQAEALPALIKLLQHKNSLARSHAAETLGSWCHQPEALPVLLKLLEDKMLHVRLSAAETLGRWGRQPEALPALIKLLEDEDAGVRCRAAETLGRWGPQAEALPALIKRLEDESADVRSDAAQALGRWGGSAEVRQAILERVAAPPLEPALDHLEALSRREAPAMPPEAARTLVEALRPCEGDTPALAETRRAVFLWLWGWVQPR